MNVSTTAPAIIEDRWVTHCPIFYGWVIMIVGSIGMIMTGPGQTYGVSVFLEHIIRDLDISRSLISSLYTLGTLVGSFALPFVGRQIDRRGPRLMVVVVAILFGLACIYLGFVWNALTLGIGFIAIRMLGQGSLSLVSQNVINQWWVKRRGMMNGLSGVIVGLLGLGGLPLLINYLIDLFGWRTTYVLLGLALLLLMAPLGYLFFRNHPEAFGLEPDGALPKVEGLDLTPPIAEVNWTLEEARQTATFWGSALGIATLAMMGTGLFFHMESIITDNGLDADVAALVFVPISVTIALVTLTGGILADRFPVRYMLSIALILNALALLMAVYLTNSAWAYFYGILLGAVMGFMGASHNVMWAAYFGRRHLGSITGFVATILVFGAALGPMPFGVARDFFGSYDLVLQLAALPTAALAVVNWFLQPPQKM